MKCAIKQSRELWYINCILEANVIFKWIQLTACCMFIFTDVPVWSKLETGRIPSASEMYEIINRQMQFGSAKSA